MFNRRITQAVALGLSAVFTVVMLAGMDQLAVQQHAGNQQQVASDGTPVQVVVVTATRLRS